MAEKQQTQPGGPAFWQQHIQTWEQSNLSQREYCRRHGLRPSAFGYWRRKLAQSSQAVDFVKISTCDRQASGLELVVGDEIILRIRNQFDSKLLTKVVQAVRSAI